MYHECTLWYTMIHTGEVCTLKEHSVFYDTSEVCTVNVQSVYHDIGEVSTVNLHYMDTMIQVR